MRALIMGTMLIALVGVAGTAAAKTCRAVDKALESCNAVCKPKPEGTRQVSCYKRCEERHANGRQNCTTAAASEAATKRTSPPRYRKARMARHD